jgi:chromosome partitioning protein
MLTVAFTNQKGGVGKTSTVVGLASALDRDGLRVLCVDLDPQADLTSWMGLDPLSTHLNVNDAIYANERGAGGGAVQRAAWGAHLHCIGSTLDLAERETDLSPGSEFRLAKALDGIDDFDVVLVDCPPSIGRLVVLGFVAATHVVIVTEPSAASLRGVENVLQTLSVVQAHYNHGLTLAGIIVNHESRTTESALRVKEIAAAYGSGVWEPHIPARAVVASAMGASAPVADYGAQGSPVDDVYTALAAKITALNPMMAA